MKTKFASILLTLASLTGLVVSAAAQNRREVVVTVPYEFVAGGETLPAGTYTVTRLSDNRLGGLSISGYETKASVFVMASEFESRPLSGYKVTFEQVGDVHFLRTIDVPDGVYTIPLPRSMNLIARTKQHDGMSASGAN